MLLPTTHNKILIGGLLLVLVSCPFVLSWFFYRHYSHNSFPLGMQLPSLSVSTLNGTACFLSYRGKKQLLIYFSAECSSCRGELTNLELLYKQFKPQVEFFAISLSKKEITRKLVSSENYSFPVFLSNHRAVKDSMKIVNIPSLLFVDEQRIIRHGYAGDRTLREDKMLIQNFCEETFISKQ
jgi:peroxiredoxin